MNNTQTVNINFSTLGGPTYIGRENGRFARDNLHLDELDVADVIFIVDIPESTYNINSSFFLGLFGDSVRRAGSRPSFIEKFHFETHGKVYKVIERGIERALMSQKELGLGA